MVFVRTLAGILWASSSCLGAFLWKACKETVTIIETTSNKRMDKFFQVKRLRKRTQSEKSWISRVLQRLRTLGDIQYSCHALFNNAQCMSFNTFLNDEEDIYCNGLIRQRKQWRQRSTKYIRFGAGNWWCTCGSTSGLDRREPWNEMTAVRMLPWVMLFSTKTETYMSFVSKVSAF